MLKRNARCVAAALRSCRDVERNGRSTRLVVSPVFAANSLHTKSVTKMMQSFNPKFPAVRQSYNFIFCRVAKVAYWSHLRFWGKVWCGCKGITMCENNHGFGAS